MERKSSTAMRGQPALRPLRGMKGQSATETLVLAGFALAFILPLVFLFLSSSNSELGKTGIAQAKISARTIADEAGEIYLQGAGAQKTILVNFPEGIRNASVENGLVVLSIDADSRTQDIVASTFANVTGNLSGKRSAGLQRIRLVNTDGTFVNITYG
ncbi:Uncharacterised protein [uncultured archaeon]|nr:Uncharacterised protein [uncultured archaeon]